jgi:hypothetical protein
VYRPLPVPQPPWRQERAFQVSQEPLRASRVPARPKMSPVRRPVLPEER